MMRGIVTDFTFEYKEQAHEYVDILFSLAKKKDSTPGDRVSKVYDMTEAYFAHVGMHADSSVLERLGTLILYDDLLDKNAHKVSQTERPILSDRQQMRRQRSEVSDVWFEDRGIDGKDYRIPTRDSNRKFRECVQF